MISPRTSKSCGRRRFLQLRVIDAQRNRANRAHIRGNVFAGGAVAARNSARQHAAFVNQRNAQPIEFVFGDIVDVFAPGEFAHAAVKFSSSSIEYVLSRLIIAGECRRVSKPLRGAPPTRCVGESGVISSGCADSSCLSSSIIRSNLTSEISGSSLHEIEIFVPAKFIAQFFDLFGCCATLYHASSVKRSEVDV